MPGPKFNLKQIPCLISKPKTFPESLIETLKSLLQKKILGKLLLPPQRSRNRKFQLTPCVPLFCALMYFLLYLASPLLIPQKLFCQDDNSNRFLQVAFLPCKTCTCYRDRGGCYIVTQRYDFCLENVKYFST